MRRAGILAALVVFGACVSFDGLTAGSNGDAQAPSSDAARATDGTSLIDAGRPPGPVDCDACRAPEHGDPACSQAEGCTFTCNTGWIKCVDHCAMPHDEKCGPNCENCTVNVPPQSEGQCAQYTIRSFCELRCLSTQTERWRDCNGDLNNEISDGCETETWRNNQACGGCTIQCATNTMCCDGKCLNVSVCP